MAKNRRYKNGVLTVGGSDSRHAESGQI